MRQDNANQICQTPVKGKSNNNSNLEEEDLTRSYTNLEIKPLVLVKSVAASTLDPEAHVGDKSLSKPKNVKLFKKQASRQ